jgi:hypothetical protein
VRKSFQLQSFNMKDCEEVEGGLPAKGADCVDFRSYCAQLESFLGSF